MQTFQRKVSIFDKKLQPVPSTHFSFILRGKFLGFCRVTLARRELQGNGREDQVKGTNLSQLTSKCVSVSRRSDQIRQQLRSDEKL